MPHLIHPDPGPWVEVFASARGRDCSERALVLRAKGIPFSSQQSRGLHRLMAPAEHEAAALSELASYERENRDWPPTHVAPELRRGAGKGVLGFAVILVSAWFFSEAGTFGAPWRGAGAAHAEALLGGEWWRSITALTLHSGPEHLLSNLIFGAFFGMLVSWSHGSGLAWAAILVGGALGNAANAWIQDPDHVSIGASTAVFCAVGLLAGSEWRRRHLMSERRLRVAAPIVMGLLLLAFHGVPEDPAGIDVLAHVSGLGFGMLLGPLLPFLTARGAADRGVQAALGAGTVLVIALAWWLALG